MISLTKVDIAFPITVPIKILEYEKKTFFQPQNYKKQKFFFSFIDLT
jgi:hypothetical protein